MFSDGRSKVLDIILDADDILLDLSVDRAETFFLNLRLFINHVFQAISCCVSFEKLICQKLTEIN